MVETRFGSSSILTLTLFFVVWLSQHNIEIQSGNKYGEKGKKILWLRREDRLKINSNDAMSFAKQVAVDIHTYIFMYLHMCACMHKHEGK